MVILDAELQTLDSGLKRLSRQYKSGTSGYCPIWALILRRELDTDAKFVVAWSHWRHPPGVSTGDRITYGEFHWTADPDPASANHVAVLYKGYILDADGVSTKEDWTKKWSSTKRPNPLLETWVEEREAGTGHDEDILSYGESVTSCPYNLRGFEEEIHNLVADARGTPELAYRPVDARSFRRPVRSYRRSR
jgi:hypothetical protein